MHTEVDQRSWHQVSVLIDRYLIHRGRVSTLNPELSDSARTASQLALGILCL